MQDERRYLKKLDDLSRQTTTKSSRSPRSLTLCASLKRGDKKVFSSGVTQAERARCPAEELVCGTGGSSPPAGAARLHSRTSDPPQLRFAKQSSGGTKLRSAARASSVKSSAGRARPSVERCFPRWETNRVRREKIFFGNFITCIQC